DAAGCVEAMPAAIRDHGQHAAFQDEPVFPALAPEDREFRLSGQHLHQLIAALMPLPRAGAIETAGENGAISEFSKICKGRRRFRVARLRPPGFERGQGIEHLPDINRFRHMSFLLSCSALSGLIASLPFKEY